MTEIELSAGLEELLEPGAELQVLADGFQFLEGPAWNPAAQELVFNDIPADQRWRWSEAGGAEVVVHPNFKANGTVFEPDGSLLVCEHASSCLVRFRPDGRRDLVAFHYQGKYLNSPNDVVVRSDGTIYFSDPDYGRRPGRVGVGRESELGFRGVFRVPAGGGETELAVAEDEFDQPNGLCFSPDESRLYVDDLTGLKVYDVAADGTLSGPRVVRDDMGRDEGGPGGPDGMKCDERGNIWCTGRGGIWVISPQDELLGILKTPEVTANLAWGGPDLRTLFLTSSTSLRCIRTAVASNRLPHHAMTAG